MSTPKAQNIIQQEVGLREELLWLDTPRKGFVLDRFEIGIKQSLIASYLASASSSVPSSMRRWTKITEER